MENAISKLTIKGYKSIRELKDFELRNINILIGPNGSGKSNFLSIFKFLRAIAHENGLPNLYVGKEGGPDKFLYLGPKLTPSITIELTFDRFLKYMKVLSFFENMNNFDSSTKISPLEYDNKKIEIKDIEKQFSYFMIYHFNDTSDLAGVKRPNSEGNFDYLFLDASNLAPFLFRMKEKHPREYQYIIEVVRLAAPFFNDFKFDLNEKTGDVKWWWSQKGSDYQFHPSQISDGSLRFICLATALLQPEPPSIILLDEPELGLHPMALSVLAGLIQKASFKSQIIVSTQSASLISQFEPEDIVIVERKDEESVFRRLPLEKLKQWLDDYSLGELWEMHLLEGRPENE